MKIGIKSLRDLYNTPHIKKLFKYSMVSVISSLVSIIVLNLAFSVFHWWSEVGSAAFANIVATVPSYYLNRSWVWGKGGKSHFWKEVMPFWVASAIGVVASTLAAVLARHYSLDHHFSHESRSLLLNAANIFAYGSLWVLKYIFFNYLFRHHHATDQVEGEEEFVNPHIQL